MTDINEQKIITEAVRFFTANDNTRDLSEIVLILTLNQAFQDFFYSEFTPTFYDCPKIFNYSDNRKTGGKIEIGEIYADEAERMEIAHHIYDAEIFINSNIDRILLESLRALSDELKKGG